MGVVATIAAKYDSRTMGLLILRREPAETIMRRWNGYIVVIVPMSSANFEMALSFSRSPVQNMRALIAGGAVKMAAHSCATLAVSRHAWLMSDIFGVLISYSGYSEVLTVTRETFTAHLKEKLGLLRGSDPGIQEIRTHAAEVERASRYLDKSTWAHICDNAKVSVLPRAFTTVQVLIPPPSVRHSIRVPGNREDMFQKKCSRCHSVVYCSSECQREDWNAFHRRECSHLAKSRRRKSFGVV